MTTFKTESPFNSTSSVSKSTMVDFVLRRSSRDPTAENMKKSDFTSKSNIETAIAAASILTPQRLAQNRLVLRILDECVAKLKLSMIIPKIFENPLTLSRILEGTQYEHLSRMLLKYLRDRVKDGKTDEFAVPEPYNEQLIAVINKFHANFEVLELLPNWFGDTTVSDHNIMEAFDLLTHITDERLHRSASNEIEKEKEMHNAFMENIALKKEIESLRRRVRNQRHQMRWKLAMRTGDSQKFQEELTVKKWQNFNLIRQEQMEQAQRIKQYNFGYNNRVNQLKEEADRLAEEFRKLKMNNAKHLEQVREEKNKLLIQLQSTIEKHDRVLGDKIKENVYLQDAYDKQRAEMDVFMAHFVAVEKQYNEIMQADRAEEMRKWNEKAKFFFQTRAVKIIQRALRHYLKEQRLAEQAAKRASRKSMRKSVKVK